MDMREDVSVKTSELLCLPSEALLYMLSYLDFRTLLSCCLCCRRLRELSDDETNWRGQCQVVFLLDKCEDELGWKQTFQNYFKEYGQYVTCYRSIRKAWNQIENYFMIRGGRELPVLQSLNGPAWEGVIETAERKIGHKLPSDLRCSLRIHNGQNIFRRDTGFMTTGGIEFTQIKSEFLVDVMTMAEKYQTSGELAGCCPITYSSFSNFNGSQMIGISDEGGYAVGEVFFPVVRQQTLSSVDQAISGRSYTEWLTNYAQALQDDVYTWHNNMVLMFYHEPSCVAVTRDMFTVRVGTCFMPELSSVVPPFFTYLYRITILMDEKAPAQCSCQLVSRHWIITDEDGNEERVSGPGVVVNCQCRNYMPVCDHPGMFPTLKPGTEYSWISSTGYSTTYGNMKGYFTMKNLRSGEMLDIECPCYHMKCLPYKLAEERQERKRDRKKRL